MAIRKLLHGIDQKVTAHKRPAAPHDPYYFRKKQAPARRYRALTGQEVEILEKNGNVSEDWTRVLVFSPFDPKLVRNCEFRGLVRLGNLQAGYLEHNELCLPIGLWNASLTDCDIGNDVVVRNVSHMSRMIVGDRSILFNLDEVICTPHAKFGAGIVKEGEPESVRVWIEVCNENGGRRILAFPGILPADAYLWSRFRGDARLMRSFAKFTEQTADRRQGQYGVIGEQCIIKDSRIIKDAWIGPHCYVKGANKLKNISLLSSEKEATQIGEGVELVNGIVGHGSRIFYGAKAVRFVTGRNVQLKYGARLINSFVGDNSTISCCEILNSLIFPFHEQHHNSSFLVAGTVMGQSNVAANATIGSNHNSRSPDGEIFAGRGFWAGLSSSFKFDSRFGSFVLAAQGDYPFEIHVPFPFSLVSNDPSQSQLSIMPGYWFLYNMYAIARNEWKFEQRDKRVLKEQKIETKPFAPDTAEEMLAAMKMLERHMGKAAAGKDIADFLATADAARSIGDIHIEGLCKTARPCRILKPVEGYRAYRQMVLYYAVRCIVEELQNLPDRERKLTRLAKATRPLGESRWWNLGGQIVLDSDVQRILRDIKTGRIRNWKSLHARYDRLWKEYPKQKLRHALGCIERLEGTPLSTISAVKWKSILLAGANAQKTIAHETRQSRKKDFENPFRRQSYETMREMEAVLGTVEGNSFIQQLDRFTQKFCRAVNDLVKLQ